MFPTGKISLRSRRGIDIQSGSVPTARLLRQRIRGIRSITAVNATSPTGKTSGCRNRSKHYPQRRLRIGFSRGCEPRAVSHCTRERKTTIGGWSFFFGTSVDNGFTRKRLVATASRRERACKRTGEPSVTMVRAGSARSSSVTKWRRGDAKRSRVAGEISLKKDAKRLQSDFSVTDRRIAPMILTGAKRSFRSYAREVRDLSL